MCCGLKLGGIGLLISLLLGPCCPDQPPVTVTLAVAPATIVEDGGTATLTATLAAAVDEDWTLHVEGQQTPTTSPAGFTLSSADIVVTAGQTAGTATVTVGTFPDDVESLSVVFRITRISSPRCSWDVDIPASALTIIHRGSLQVTLLPSLAVVNGAQWRVDGGAWQNSGAIVRHLTAGAHTVDYKAVPHFVEPASESVTITDGVLTQITRTYTPMLTVLIEPATAVTAGAQWLLTAGPAGFDNSLHNSGDEIPAPPGDYTVSFTDVAGFVTPPNNTVTITDLPATTTGTYTPMLTVLIEPGQAVTWGAQWFLLSGPVGYNPNPHDSGVSVPAPPGDYVIRFTPVTGYIRPADIPVTITDTPDTETGTYTPTLQVLIEPQGAIDDGAQWFLTAGPAGFDSSLHDSGDTVPAPPGDYNIRFTDLFDWQTPPDIPVTITDAPANRTGTYFQIPE